MMQKEVPERVRGGLAAVYVDVFEAVGTDSVEKFSSRWKR